MGVETYGPMRKVIAWYSATDQFMPFTRWVYATGVDSVAFVWTLLAEQDQLKVRPAFQLAEVRTDKPATWTTSGLTYLEADGESYGTVDLSGAGVTDSHFWIRFGIDYSSGASPLYGSGEVSLVANVTRNFGRLVGSGDFIARVLKSADPPEWTETIGPWIPTSKVADVKAAFLLTGVSGKMAYRLAYRTAATDTLAPGPWTALEAAYSTTTADVERLLADTAVSAGSNAWIQLGVRYKAADSSFNGEAAIHAIIATRG